MLLKIKFFVCVLHLKTNNKDMFYSKSQQKTKQKGVLCKWVPDIYKFCFEYSFVVFVSLYGLPHFIAKNGVPIKDISWLEMSLLA